MTNAEPTGVDEVAGHHLAEQFAAVDRTISAANRPGDLDGMFAFHVLRGVDLAFGWKVNPFTGPWLNEQADRLRNAPQLAVLGYGLAHFSGHSSQARTEVTTGLRELMRREPFPVDGVTFAPDPRQLLGITLAADILRDDLPQFREWLLHVVNDPRFRAQDPRADLVRRHVRSRLTDQPSTIGDLADRDDPAELAWVHWMLTTGTARLADPVTDLPLLQRRILTGLLRTEAAALSICDAALLRAAAAHIVAASIDSAVLSRSHIGVVLRRFPAAMKRWRWDDPVDVQHPIRWPVTSEREVQDIVWILLRAVFDDLVDEEPLPRLGHSSYRADFGLPRLGVLVEIKYVRSAAEFKKVEKEVLEDSVAYLRDRTTYKKIVVFIYDASSSVQQHNVTADALLKLDHVIDVIIVSRPSQLPAPGTDPSVTPARPARRARTSRTGRGSVGGAA